jgi:hypothetical protein
MKVCNEPCSVTFEAYLEGKAAELQMIREPEDLLENV